MKSAPAPGFSSAQNLVFILGRPLDHSLSPLMHNSAFRALGMSWVYAPLDVSSAQLEEAMGLLRSANVRGSNVTVPYKEEVLPYLDRVEEGAQKLRSVNTLYRRGDQLWGASTDGEGFLRSLGRWRAKLEGSKGLLVGAGGAARPVAHALAESGVRILYVANRTPARAGALIQGLLKLHPRLQAHAVSIWEGEKILGQMDWVIQSTSLGLKKKDTSPISLRRARRGTLAVDLIYHRETAFLREARRLCLPHLSGMGMLLHQGALAFEYWTGRKAPLPVMQKALGGLLSRP